MAKLYLTALGCSARERFCQELQTLEYGQGALVLPNRLLLDEVRQRNNIEAMGMDTLANRLLNLNGYVNFHQINRRSQELVIQELIEDLVSNGNMEYFGSLAQKTGFVKAMTSLVGQLSRSGSTMEQIVSILSDWGRSDRLGQKDREVALLYQYYRNYLKQKNWFDLEGKYRLALRVLQNDKSRLPWKKLYFSDFYSFDALQLDFIKALSKRCQVTIGLCYEKNLENTERGKLFAAAHTTYLALNDLCLDEGVEQLAATGTAAPGCEHLCRSYGLQREPLPTKGEVQLYSFGDREKELRFVLTQVKLLLEQGVAAQQIVVAVRDLTPYTGLRLAADEYGIPVNLPQTSSLAVQPLTELLLLLLQCAVDNHDGAEAYFQLLSCPLAHLLLQLDGEAVQNLRQEHYYRSRSSVQEAVRQQFPVQNDILALWDAFIARLQPQADMQSYAALLQELLAHLELSKRLGELYKSARLELDAMALCLQTQSELERVLRQLMEDYGSCGQSARPLTLAEWQAILLEAVQQAEVVLQQGRQDGVLLTEVINLQGLHFDYVFLLGLREGEFPKINNENWIYNDKERKELQGAGLEMPNTSLAYAEDACFFGAAIACARRQLVLCSFVDDQAGASPYLDGVQRLFAGDGENIEPLAMLADPAKPAASAQEYTQKVNSLENDWFREQWGEILTQAAAADSLRRQDERYNGVLQDEALQRAAARAVGSSFSASALASYAACPFQYLGQRVWRQQEFAAMEEEVTPAAEGDLLHQVLAAFLGRYLNKKLTAKPLAVLQQELAEVYRAAAEAAVEKGVIADSILWRAEQPRLQRLLDMWLEYEYNDQQQWSFTPCAVEWDFSSKNGRPLRLFLADGRPVSLVGRIDRLDSDGQRVFVTDYKRSAASVPSSKELAEGFDVQLPLYLLAVAGLYKGAQSVAGGSYYVLRDGMRKSSFLLEGVDNPSITDSKRSTKEISSWDSFQSFAQRLICGYIEGIYGGNFAVAPRKACSPYCALRDICRLRELGQAEGGQADE